MTQLDLVDYIEAKPQSPFLPGTRIQFAHDSTSIGYLKVCPRLYQYIMIEGWSKKDESVHLRFGLELHQALQDYEMLRADDGTDHETALHVVVRELLERTFGWAVDEGTKAGKYKNRASLLRTVINTLDKYRDDPAKTYVMDNGKPAVELSFRFELGFGPEASETRYDYTYESDEARRIGHSRAGLEPIKGTRQPYLLSGHLDRVVTFNDSLFVMDHKTTTSTPGDYYFNQFEPNNQMTLYSLAAQVILGSPIRGVIINAIQILVDDNEFKRGFTYRTADQLEEWTQDLEVTLREAEAYAIEGHWPMRDTSCDKFGGCQFREVCSKSPHVREAFLRADFVKLPEDERWNPLRSRG